MRRSSSLGAKGARGAGALDEGGGTTSALKCVLQGGSRPWPPEGAAHPGFGGGHKNKGSAPRGRRHICGPSQGDKNKGKQEQDQGETMRRGPSRGVPPEEVRRKPKSQHKDLGRAETKAAERGGANVPKRPRGRAAVKIETGGLPTPARHDIDKILLKLQCI